MSIPNISHRVQLLKQKFTNSVGLPFRDLLPESTIRKSLQELQIKYRQRLFDPFVTLWAFLSQALDTDKSCHNAVSRVIAYLADESAKIPSEDTSAYCQARKRLPEKLLSQLFGQVAQGLENQITLEHLWCGRHVKVIDGSTVSMPDTPSNQKAYPQPGSQASGCGFPMAKIGALFSLTTGAAVALVIDVFNTHDVKLARVLYKFLNPGDVLVGDSVRHSPGCSIRASGAPTFCSYADLVFLQERDCDAVFREHPRRQYGDKRLKQKRFSSYDRLELWQKPKSRPKSLSKEEFSRLPKTLTVRAIKYYMAPPGYRTKHVILITTLLDEELYPATEIMRLYGMRWDVELDLRHLKTTLGMDVLRSLTPSMARKEIYAYLLAYNLLRTVMWEAGTTRGVNPLRLSLQGTRQHLNNFAGQLASSSTTKRQQLYHTLLELIAHKPVAERKGRHEPRVRKRRPKSYPLMQKPRTELRHQLRQPKCSFCKGFSFIAFN